MSLILKLVVLFVYVYITLCYTSNLCLFIRFVTQINTHYFTKIITHFLIGMNAFGCFLTLVMPIYRLHNSQVWSVEKSYYLTSPYNLLALSNFLQTFLRVLKTQSKLQSPLESTLIDHRSELQLHCISLVVL